LAVLGLLEIGPLHPYGIQRLMKLWGKDKVVNVGQRANLYRTIKRLTDDGLIAVGHTERDQQFPERTVYELTDAGRRATRTWLSTMLSTPRNEYPEFPAALSFLMILGPEEARVVLEQRASVLAEQLSEIDRELKEYSDAIPRVSMLEDEYLRAVTAAELKWLRAVVNDLQSGALQWNEADFEVAQADLQE
jgi:DNA-binding PadR family transcriptional regulator